MQIRRNKILTLCLFFLSVTLYGQSFVISADKMNVAYIGLDNPLTIIAEGYNCNQLEASCSNGTIVKAEDCSFNFRPAKEGVTEIEVKVRTASGLKLIGVQKFRVKVIPLPTATIMGRSMGTIRVAQFKVQVGILAKIDCCDINATMKIVNFKMAFYREGQLLHSCNTTDSYFDKTTRDKMSDLKPGDKVAITDIKAIGPERVVRSLNDINLTLN